MNLKFLYGPDIEVLTLCDNTPSPNYQAVAVKFDRFAITWKKYLHTEMCISTPVAIQTLLEMSEGELTKYLSAAGFTVPFQGTMVETLNRDWGGSVQSNSVDVATPTSTLLCTASDNFVHVEYSVEEAAELSVDESLVEEAVVEDVNEKSLADEPISASEELEVGSQKSDPIYFDWRPFRPRRIRRKRRKRNQYSQFGRTSQRSLLKSLLLRLKEDIPWTKFVMHTSTSKRIIPFPNLSQNRI